MPVVLSDAEVQFIESIGLFYERLGVPRIGGRMVGLMLLSPDPLPHEEIAAALQVSKASVSTNARLFTRLGFLEEVRLPGDRRAFVRFSTEAFDGRMALVAGVTRVISSLADQGRAAIAPQNHAARERLDYARDFAEFLHEGANRLQTEWLARRSRNDPDRR